MSNRSKEGDFNLDQELYDNIIAAEEGKAFDDSHEDAKTNYFEQSIKGYNINPNIKKREELINSDIILSVRNLKQFFFFGSAFNKQKLKAVS